MSLESFYGGKQGVSPIVKARFQYITSAKQKDENGNIMYDHNNKPIYIDRAYGDMVNYQDTIPPDSEVMETMFASINYEDVWYGQLAIIDTPNRRNKNNGKLFRRVLGRTELEAQKDGGTLHGEYIGCIVGPSEGFPNIRIDGSVDNMKQTILYSFNESNDYSYPIGDNAIADKATSVQDLNRIHTLKAKYSNRQLVPGATLNNQGKFVSSEDGIYYSWVNVRNNVDNEIDDTYVYLGFTIPYTIFDFQFQGVDWNQQFSATQTNRTAYANGTEPFFVNWAINIPRGITGNHSGFLRRTTFGEFRNLTPTTTTKPILYDFADIWSESDGTFNLPTYGTSAKPWPTFNNLKTGASILVYTFFINKVSGTQKQTLTADCYIGSIKDITSITLATNGEVKVQYADGNSAVSINANNKIRWINSITYTTDASTGHLKLNVLYNDGTTSSNFYLPYFSGTQIETVNNKYVVSTDKVNVDGSVLTSTLKQKDGSEFQFQFVDNVKVDSLTKELKYRLQPAQSPTVDNGFISFSDKVYLNGIEQTYLASNGHLYIRYGSSAKRYTGTSYTSSDPSYNPTLYWYVRTSDNTVWYRGGDIPKFTTTQETQGVWWLDLGVIIKTEKGVRVTSTVDTFRYNLYYKIIKNSQSASFNWNTVADDATLMLSTIFNKDWTIDAGTANAFDANPYDEGHIFLYNYPDINTFMSQNGYSSSQWKEAYKAILKLPPVTDSIGNFVYYVNQNSDGHAYFYDRSRGLWEHAGAWTSGDNSMQILVKDYSSGSPVDVPGNKTKLPEGFTFVYANSPTKIIELPTNLWVS